MHSSVPPTTVGLDPERLQRAFALLQGWISDGVTTAIAAVVTRRGTLAGSFYGGTVSPEPGAQAISATSLFHLASIGKPITALAVVLLVEQGRLALDDPVASILPSFVGHGRDTITVRQLLTHTSGLPQDPDLTNMPPDADTATELQSYLGARLDVPVGSKVEYSNVGYGLLGLVVEAIAQQPFAAFLREQIFGPVGMSHASIAPSESLYPQIVHVGGTPEPGSRYERFNSAHARRRTHPAGSVVGTARDVAQFLQLFLDRGMAGGRRVLAPATAQLMATNQTAGLRGGIEGFMTWDDCAWGLGFELHGTKKPHYMGELSSPETFGHSGVAGTFAWADPARQLAVVMLGNRLLHNRWNESRWSRFSTAVAAAVVD
jgi:CubicO group peptidase (beta-lactamase class C family)